MLKSRREGVLLLSILQDTRHQGVYVGDACVGGVQELGICGLGARHHNEPAADEVVVQAEEAAGHVAALGRRPHLEGHAQALDEAQLWGRGQHKAEGQPQLLVPASHSGQQALEQGQQLVRVARRKGGRLGRLGQRQQARQERVALGYIPAADRVVPGGHVPGLAPGQVGGERLERRRAHQVHVVAAAVLLALDGHAVVKVVRVRAAALDHGVDHPVGSVHWHAAKLEQPLAEEATQLQVQARRHVLQVAQPRLEPQHDLCAADLQVRRRVEGKLGHCPVFCAHRLDRRASGPDEVGQL